MPELVHISVAGQSLPHEGAPLHVSGAANYTDDIPLPDNALHVALGMSTIAHGRIKSMDLSSVAAAPGVVMVVTAPDVPGSNLIGPVLHDDPIFAESLVEFAGQSLFVAELEEH